jgi:hypothetical protein
LYSLAVRAAGGRSGPPPWAMASGLEWRPLSSRPVGSLGADAEADSVDL